MHASQIQGCIVEQRVEKKRKIADDAESVWVHNVVTVLTGKVAGQCAMPHTPRWLPIEWRVHTRHSMGSQWRFWSNAVDESGEAHGR